MLTLWSLSCGGVPYMRLVLSMTFHFHYYIWGCMCSTGPFQFNWLRGYIHSSCYYHHQPYRLSYFSVVVCLRYLLHHNISLIAYTFRENRDFVFIIIVQFMMSAGSRIRFGLQIVFVYWYISPSHYHHCANFIWRHWTYKMPVRIIISSVWVKLSIFSRLTTVHYMGLCVLSLPISLTMTERIYTLSYYHHQIGSMNYYPLFMFRSWNNGMRCMSQCVLMEMLYWIPV